MRKERAIFKTWAYIDFIVNFGVNILFQIHPKYSTVNLEGTLEKRWFLSISNPWERREFQIKKLPIPALKIRP